MDLFVIAALTVAVILAACWLNAYHIWNGGVCPNCGCVRTLSHVTIDQELRNTYYWSCKCPDYCTTGELRFNKYCKTFKNEFPEKKIKGAFKGAFVENMWEIDETTQNTGTGLFYNNPDLTHSDISTNMPKLTPVN